MDEKEQSLEVRANLGLFQIWCSKARREHLISGVNSDTHSQGVFRYILINAFCCYEYCELYISPYHNISYLLLMSCRVLGTLQNFPPFAETFKCKNGSYMAPEKQCHVWWCAGLQHRDCPVTAHHILHSFSPLRMFERPPGRELLGERTFHFLRTEQIRNQCIDKWMMEINQQTVPPETDGELSLWLRYCRSSNHILLHSGYNHSFSVMSSSIFFFFFNHVWLSRCVFHLNYCTSRRWERSRQTECAGNRWHMNKAKHPLTLTLM